jgi:hypothetical protein
VAEGARRRCLEDARLILDEGLLVFGRRVGTGVRSTWNTDPLTGEPWPTKQPWWKIDISPPGQVSDVKYVWEAARHRDLVVLARAGRLEAGGPWLDGLSRLLWSWCHESEPERGVNWYSSLELALRAIAWNQVLSLCGERLGPELRSTMERTLLASARHILLELPYTLSSMRNNHLLGDALGLTVLSRMFSRAPGAARWSWAGHRLFASQLARQMRPDGSMIEDSLSYQRFVLEMLVVRVLLGGAPAAVTHALRSASLHQSRLGVFAGDVPQMGDWDGGRVLACSGEAHDVAGSVALGLALSGEPVAREWYDAYDELAWYGPPPGDARPRAVPAVRSATRAVRSGGIARASRGPWQVWFKVGSGPSHGHADLTSVFIKHEGHWLLVDPGTGAYNGPAGVRNGLRSSSAHPVRRPAGRDQLEPHRAFRWRHTARGHVAAPIELADRTVLFGWHDAYARLGLRVGRVVVVADAHVAVYEYADASVSRWSLTVPLHPDVDVKDGALVASGRTVRMFGLHGHRLVRGQADPFAGWHSHTYGDWQPATWIQVEGDHDSTRIWGFGVKPDLEGGPLLDVSWLRYGARLTVMDPSTGDRVVVSAP